MSEVNNFLPNRPSGNPGPSLASLGFEGISGQEFAHRHRGLLLGDQERSDVIRKGREAETFLRRVVAFVALAALAGIAYNYRAKIRQFIQNR